MDFNVQIIEAVKFCPLLYSNNGCTLSERDFWWKKLASEIEVDDRHLKSIWHILRQQYIQCLELEHANVEVDFKYKEDLEFLKPYVNIQTKYNGENKSIRPDTPEFEITYAEDDLLEEVFFQDVISDDSKDCEDPLQEESHDNSFNMTVTFDDVIEEVTDDIANDEISWDDNKNLVNGNENNGIERSEDVIFGELVTAMLQKMPPNKKRNVKKEIMNLLLT